MNRLLFVGVAILFTFIGYFLHPVFKKQVIRNDVLSSSKECPYSYLNQLRCEPDLVKKKKEYTVLRNKLIDFIEEQKRIGNITGISVYFRDLQNGPTMNINATDNYTPASLLKLPLLISYFDKAENDPKLLATRIKAADYVPALPQNILPADRAMIGKEYSIEELITILITQSDNISGHVLLEYLNRVYPNENLIYTLSDLGIIDPRKSIDEQYVSAQSYASIFRILYNSSYLNLEMSNKALALLVKSEYKDGLVAGVPGDVEVAHKFGERKRDSEQQLHDCGIVYYPKNPYILCVMTKGSSKEQLAKIIKEISHDVYGEVLEQN